MIRTYKNYKLVEFDSATGESLTIPGQTISIAQMIERRKAGMPLTGTSMSYLDSDDNEEALPPIKDLTDLENINNEVRAINDKYDKYVQNKKQKDTEEAEKRRINAAAEALLKERERSEKKTSDELS